MLTWCAAGEGVVATMAIRVNAAQAACLLGRGEKTVRAWFRDGVIRGAEKVSRPGQPDMWEIDIDTLYEAASAASLIESDWLRVLAHWLNLEHGGLGSVSAPLSPGRSQPGISYVAGTFRTAADAARWLLDHGVHSPSTPKDWPGWPPAPLDKANVLSLAIERQDVSNHRVTWRLHECDVEGCVCHRML